MKRWSWMWLALVALLAAGCSDDDGPTDPGEPPDPISWIGQVSAIPGRPAYAVGREGSLGVVYSRQGGTWGPIADQPGGSDLTGVVEHVTTAAPPDTLLHVFGPRTGFRVLAEGQWTVQTSTVDPDSGRLFTTVENVWFGGPDGLLLRENFGDWETVVSPDGAGSAIVDAARVHPAGALFARSFARADTGCVLNVSNGIAGTVYEFDTPITAVASSDGPDRWAAGHELHRYDGDAWEYVLTVSDTTRVVSIGLPPDDSVQLVCANGVIYRWDEDGLAVEQEFPLREDLTAVCWVAENEIYGSLNFVEDNTGHWTGIIVRYDGSNWVTEFLAPPDVPGGE